VDPERYATSRLLQADVIYLGFLAELSESLTYYVKVRRENFYFYEETIGNHLSENMKKQ
jgi:hypothetical protein